MRTSAGAGRGGEQSQLILCLSRSCNSVLNIICQHPPPQEGNLLQKKIWWADKLSGIRVDWSLLSGAQKQSRVASSPWDMGGERIHQNCQWTPCSATAHRSSGVHVHGLQPGKLTLPGSAVQSAPAGRHVGTLRVRPRTWEAPWGPLQPSPAQTSLNGVHSLGSD